MSSYPIQHIEGIGPSYADKLLTAGIKTTKDLLVFCCEPRGRKTVAAKTGVNEKLLLKWANMADMMRITGIGPEFAELLEATGVDTVKELRNRRADNLAASLKTTNQAKRLTRAVPAESVVTRWLEQAKVIEPTISH